MWVNPGLTTFGWLLVAGAAAAVLGNKDRRDKMMGAVKGFTDKMKPAHSGAPPSA